MLVSGFRITGAHLIRQLRCIQNAQTIQHNMDMDIAGSMVSILMGTDQNLMPREMLPCKLHSHPLSLLHGQSKLPVLWVEAQNVMMGFDLVLSLILFELLVRLVTFAGKGGRVTVDPFQYVPRPQHCLGQQPICPD